MAVSENLFVWQVNGISLELDLEDAGDAEKYEAAFKQMSEDEKEMKKATEAVETSNLAEKIRDYCKMMRNLYDNIFGNGTSDRIFNGIKENTRKYDEVYEDFLSFVKKQSAYVTERKLIAHQKYSPKSNKK